jgi:RHS repeat-associated protein
VEGARRTYAQGGRLLRRDRTEYVWDEEGRLVEQRVADAAGNMEPRWRYVWNAAGLLRAAEAADGLRVEFTYDPFARRTGKVVTRIDRDRDRRVPVSATRFVRDGNVLAHEVRRAFEPGGAAAVVQKSYLFEDDGFVPIAHCEEFVDGTAGSRRTWFHYVNDPVGTPLELIDDSGRVACRLARGAWDVPQADSSVARTAIRFPGQYADEETGLYFNRWRYYDPAIARYVSPDPSSLLGGPRSTTTFSPARCCDAEYPRGP